MARRKILSAARILIRREARTCPLPGHVARESRGGGGEETPAAKESRGRGRRISIANRTKGLPVPADFPGKT